MLIIIMITIIEFTTKIFSLSLSSLIWHIAAVAAACTTSYNYYCITIVYYTTCTYTCSYILYIIVPGNIFKFFIPLTLTLLPRIIHLNALMQYVYWDTIGYYWDTIGILWAFFPTFYSN